MSVPRLASSVLSTDNEPFSKVYGAKQVADEKCVILEDYLLLKAASNPRLTQSRQMGIGSSLPEFTLCI